jgi:SAM-dependent methyltransferase
MLVNTDALHSAGTLDDTSPIGATAVEAQAIARRLKAQFFCWYGRRPYARGYASYRRIKLEEYVARPMPNGVLPEGWGLWLDERAVEYPWFFSRLPRVAGNLLDAGSVLNHDYVLSHRALVNKKLSIFTLASEGVNFCHRGISYVYGDLRDTCYRNNFFDWIVSISTLEHVGMDNSSYTRDKGTRETDSHSYLRAVAELHRILKRDGILYLTVPFGSAQNHGWLQVFDSRMIENILEAFRPSSVRESYFRYSSTGWQISSAALCSTARYFDILSTASPNTEFAAAEAVVCLEMTK